MLYINLNLQTFPHTLASNDCVTFHLIHYTSFGLYAYKSHQLFTKKKSVSIISWSLLPASRTEELSFNPKRLQALLPYCLRKLNSRAPSLPLQRRRNKLVSQNRSNFHQINLCAVAIESLQLLNQSLLAAAVIKLLRLSSNQIKTLLFSCSVQAWIDVALNQPLQLPTSSSSQWN